jgi:hypothetical protein
MLKKEDYPRDPNYKIRPAYYYFKEKLGENLIGAEVGVYLGITAEHVLKNFTLKEYVMVDPYIPYGDMSKTQEDHDQLFGWTYPLFKDMPNVKFIRLKSEEAVLQFPDEYFDFVYIDGNHEYLEALKDCRLWYPKVKKGGILAGHDFLNITATNWDCYRDVIRAIVEFADEVGLGVRSRRDPDTNVYDWWIDK